MTTTVLNTNIREVGEKIPDVTGLVKKTDYNAKFETLRENTLLLLIIINLQVKYLIRNINKQV